MLTDAERLKIEATFGLYETRSASALDGLRIIQESRGWVSDEALVALAQYLDVSADYLESLATFYSMVFRRPVGRHVIMICQSVCCWISGSAEVTAYLSDRLSVGLGDTTADGRFTLLPVVCLGACDRAPAMMIDGDLHGPLTADEIDSILSFYP